MAFWDAQKNAPLPMPARVAIGCYIGYAALSIGYVVWTGLEIRFATGEIVQGAVRAVCFLGLAFALKRKKRFALWLAYAFGAVGGVGLLMTALALQDAGLVGMPLGVVTVVYSVASALCQLGGALLLAREDSRAAFSPHGDTQVSAPVNA